MKAELKDTELASLKEHIKKYTHLWNSTHCKLTASGDWQKQCTNQV